MRKKAVNKWMLMIFAIFPVFLLAQEIKEAINVLDNGIEAYQQGKNQEAQALFTEASAKFKSLLQGILSPEDEAYIRYYNATASYYVARISKNKAGFDDAINEFQQALAKFKDISTYGDEYMKSKYMIGLSYFRKYQLETVERNMIKLLSDCISAFKDFLSDSVVKISKDEIGDLKENAKFFIGYSNYMLGYYRIFLGSVQDAKENMQQAVTAFDSLWTASQEHIAIASRFMSAISHYGLARVYMRVSEENWQTTKISTDPRSKAIENELNTAIKIAQDVVTKSGAYQNINKKAKLLTGLCKVGLGSIGDKTNLTSAITELTDLRDVKDIGDEAVLRVGDGQLMQYLVFSGAEQAVSGIMSSVAQKYPEGLYWSGWTAFVSGNFDGALTSFNNFTGRIPRADTRYLELEADAKFRIAESFFWKGVREVNITLLDQAKAIYTNLVSPKSEYYSRLTDEQIRRANTRLFLINVEGMLQGTPDVKLFDAAMVASGLSLPADAESYIEAGKYFLEKGIREAENKREVALKFAERAFDLVIGSNVSAEIKNRAKFLKGVALVKLSTLYEGAKLSSVAGQARGVLADIAAPYDAEAKYVTGISYFIENDWENAKAAFSTLKGRGHIRAAFYYGLCLRGDCRGQAQTFMQIMSTVKDRTDFWYQSAELELAKLPCKNEVTSPGPLAGVMSPPPMTYENLVDEEADRARKKHEALLIWQRSHKFASIVEIDDLITDKPPKTNIIVEFYIEPKGGEESFFIDGKENVASIVEPSHYKAELTRGKHIYMVKKKGFYIAEGEIKVSKTEKFTINLNKAVRYTKASDIRSSSMPIDIQPLGEHLVLIDGSSRMIMVIKPNGEVLKKLPFDSIGVSYATAVEIDGEVIYVVDSRGNKVVRTNLDGSETKVIVYPMEDYDGKKVSNPTDIALWNGNLYLVDSGNHRILRFEGESFRKAFGSDSLESPFGIGIDKDSGDLYVADWVKGAIYVFSEDEYKSKITVQGFKDPVRVKVDSEGYVWIVDMISGKVGKYDKAFRQVALLENFGRFPRGIAYLGKGTDSSVYIVTSDKTYEFKGSWNTGYLPE